ncbi:CoA pyrophosphatase [Corynebacterium sp.]|uniref:NUDIX hydrolase n=1 Tax=Corynebacterium sp. TaxID=1720 RepID=UPI002A90D039|nr:CoA pyrophosphatase [Corynebacterium sp.]MDY5784965.1 CoA pyrophosphatase [Corynebacterium sp.]
MVDVALQPDRAPGWMGQLIRGLESPTPSNYARAQLARRTPRAGGEDDSAVLMLLSGDESAVELPGDASLLITHRTPSMRSHSGQMAFPGGKIDPADAGPVDAALREAEEETGLERNRVAPLAALGTVTAGGSGRAVRPILAYSADPGRVHVASPAETDDVFFVPVSTLIDPANRFQVSYMGWRGPAFAVKGYVVWGFTGVLLDVLLDTAGWATPWPVEDVISLSDALRASRNREQHS